MSFPFCPHRSQRSITMISNLYGDAEMVQLLLDLQMLSPFMNINDQDADMGATALHYSSSFGHASCVSMILRAGQFSMLFV